MPQKLVLLFFIIALFSLNLTAKNSYNNPDGEKDGVLIHITSGYENPHKVVMALRMATTMMTDKDVLVYIDINGIEFILKDSNDITYPTFPSAQESLKKLFEHGIKVMACPGCMKAAGKTKEDLMEGVLVADKAEFFNFTKGRILTLDY